MLDALPVLDQLYSVHLEQEWWQEKKLSYDEFIKYTDKLIRQGNIFFVVDATCIDGEKIEKVVGYTEVWKINFEQFGKLLCMEAIDASENDVSTGNIAYVANVWIAEEYRRGETVKKMKKMYFEFTKDCVYHVGEAKRKATGLVKVFRADKIKGV